MSEPATLKRTLSLPLVTLYGLGTILGAGIYVLLGKVAGLAGMFAPVSFVLASIVAGFSAFSYAELSSNFPRSAGEAVYAQKAFALRWLSGLTGWSVVLIGTVSAATMVKGFQGYLMVFLQFPEWITIILLVILLGAIAIWGITESISLAALITVIEILGLIFVIVLSADNLSTFPERFHELTPTLSATAWVGISLGAFLAFYAFIGFEDIVNIAEEVKRPEKNLPYAIILALIISTVLYLLVSLAAVLSLPADELARSDAPLARLLEDKGFGSKTIISSISLIAIINGALIQLIMASRLIYGMGSQAMAPRLFSRVNPKTRTPLIATVFISIMVIVLALWLPLVTLAEATSFVTLSVFALMNLSLLRLKLSNRDWRSRGNPVWVPATGLLCCLIFLMMQMYWG